MLVLTRKVGERIAIGDGVVIEVLRVQGHQVRIGLVAPKDQRISRLDRREQREEPAEASTGEV